MKITHKNWRGTTDRLSIEQAVAGAVKGTTDYYSRGVEEALEESRNHREFTSKLATMLIEKGLFSTDDVQLLLGSSYMVEDEI